MSGDADPLDDIRAFRVWLLAHVEENTPIGDLAHDVGQDGAFPFGSSVDEQRAYVVSVGSPTAVAAFDAACTLFSAEAAVTQKEL